MDYRRTYRSAAVSFADLVSRIPAGRWDSPGHGDRTVRDLVAHTVSEALQQVPQVLGTFGGVVVVDSPEAYWVLAAKDAPGTTSGTKSAGELAGQATAALAAVNDDDIVATPVGGMRVRDWLPTRTFQLVVHGLDVAAAAGVPLEPAPAAVAEAAGLAARIAALSGDGLQVLRALTGRAPLPPGYTVI